MGTFLKELWKDPAKFRAVARGLVVIIAQLAGLGVIDITRFGLSSEQAASLAAFITGGAIMVPSSDKKTIHDAAGMTEKQPIGPTAL